jgi:hypothetical protein
LEANRFPDIEIAGFNSLASLSAVDAACIGLTGAAARGRRVARISQ